MFMLKNAEKEKSNKQLYLWNRSTLHTSEINFTSVALLEHTTNLTYLPLISSCLVDTDTENVDILSDMTLAKTMMLSYAHMAGIDLTILDTEQLTHVATSTLAMVHQAVSQVINNSFMFLVWLHKIITVAFVVLLILLLAVLIL